MSGDSNQILSHEQIIHKIKRIAYQIYETFVDQDEIVIAGITSGGYLLAEEIAKQLGHIAPFKIHLCKVVMDKEALLQPVETSLSSEVYKGKALILVDDVLNSGGTLIYAVKHFLDVPLKKFKTVVLVDRNHKRYPVKADFKGISLSTSLQEHVSFTIKNGRYGVFLK